MTEVKQEEEAVAMEQDVKQEAEQPTNKRKAEEEAVGDDGDAHPAAKAVKTEEAAPVEAAPEAAAEDADAAEPTAEGAEAASAEAAVEAAPAEPVTIGYKTFASGKECFSYYHGLIFKLRKYQNLNDYEFHMVRELIKTGHPDAARKLEGGVRAIQIREVEIGSCVTSCFFITHDDGSEEDVSYRKCLASLFKEMKDLAAGNTSAVKNMSSNSGRGRAGRGGGRGGGRGRGGRGRGRGGR